MKTLGIDPGFGRIGYGCIERIGSRLICHHFGVIETEKGPIPMRLKAIHDEISKLIEEFQPDTMATEKLIFAANRTTALDVSKALGVILLTSEQAHIPWVEYGPGEVKLSVTGNGAAEKKQVKFMTQKLLGLEAIKGHDDAADALAIALTHCLRSSLVPKR